MMCIENAGQGDFTGEKSMNIAKAMDFTRTPEQIQAAAHKLLDWRERLYRFLTECAVSKKELDVFVKEASANLLTPKFQPDAKHDSADIATTIQILQQPKEKNQVCATLHQQLVQTRKNFELRRHVFMSVAVQHALWRGLFQSTVPVF